MTTPTTFNIEASLPYTIAAGLGWNKTVVIIQPDFRDPSTSSPESRIKIPAGETRVSVTYGMGRFALTPVVIVDGGEITYPEISQGETRLINCGLKVNGELEFRIPGSANTNDRIVSNIGITVFPSQPFKATT